MSFKWCEEVFTCIEYNRLLAGFLYKIGGGDASPTMFFSALDITLFIRCLVCLCLAVWALTLSSLPWLSVCQLVCLLAGAGWFVLLSSLLRP